MKLVLPISPSLNHYWLHTIRPGAQFASVYLSAEGKTFRKQVGIAVTKQLGRYQALTGRLSIRVVIHPRDRRAMDIDNRLKALLDALTHAGVWVDDQQIDRITLERGAIVKGGCCEIRIAVIATVQQKQLFAGNES